MGALSPHSGERSVPSVCTSDHVPQHLSTSGVGGGGCSDSTKAVRVPGIKTPTFNYLAMNVSK